MSLCSGFNYFVMNKRLEKIASFVRPGRGLVDVGTDHGYLPLWLAEHGYEGALFASDIVPKPLASAERNFIEAGFEDRIELLLCDGLSLCPPEKINTIVVAGMGGDTICGILDRAEWCLDEAYTLILQPMTKCEVLRFWLVNNGFYLRREEYVRDCGTIYQVIEAGYGKVMSLSDAELYIGAWENVCRDPLLPDILRACKIRFNAEREGLLRAAAPNRGRLALCCSILEEISNRLVEIE